MTISSTEPAIDLSAITKTFTRRGAEPVHAVRGLDLHIETGEIVAFLGPNGAGKTTTLDVVLGLTEPTTGTARVLGRRPREAVEAGRISAVLQSGGLLADLTVRETVQVVAGLFPSAAPVDDVMDRAGLGRLADRRVSKCSGGEQQRLRFALALLPEPDLLVLDEPTAGMDVGARREFWETMHAEARNGRTVVFATHYLEEANAFAQRIVLVADGRVVADGPTEEIRAQASGRIVSIDAGDPDTLATRLRQRPGVTLVETLGRRVSAHVGATTSDELARAMLDEPDTANLEVSSGSLETAFMTLTAATGADAASDAEGADR